MSTPFAIRDIFLMASMRPRLEFDWPRALVSVSAEFYVPILHAPKTLKNCPRYPAATRNLDGTQENGTPEHPWFLKHPCR